MNIIDKFRNYRRRRKLAASADLIQDTGVGIMALVAAHPEPEKAAEMPLIDLINYYSEANPRTTQEDK